MFFSQSQKLGNEGICGVVAHFRWRAALLDRAFVDEDDAVGDFEGLVLVMRDEDRGEAHEVVEFAQPTAKVFPDLGVEGTKGFVKQEHLGAVGQSTGKGHSLALSTGELGGQAFLVAFQLRSAQKLGDIAAIRRNALRHRRLFLLGASLFFARVPTNYRGAPHFLSGKPSIEGGAPHLAHGVPHSNAIVRAWELGAPHQHGDSPIPHHGAPHYFGGARRRDARVPPSKCRSRVF